MLFLRLALAGLLYLFLACAIYILWRDLRDQQGIGKRSDRMVKPIEVTVRGKVQVSRFTTPYVEIGRDHSCILCLQDSTVSARHARLSFREENWWLQDLGSKNGTYINQQPVIAPVVLADGDELRFGQVVTLIHILPEEA